MKNIGMFPLAIFLFCAFNLKEVGCTVVGPIEITRTIGENAHFRWNSTINDIVDATWGLCNDGANTISTIFVSVGLKLSGGQDIAYNYGYLNVSHYHGRVKYGGNIEKGQAWFSISNLELNDTRHYCWKMREGPKSSPAPYYNYKVMLNVLTTPSSTVTPTPTTTQTVPISVTPSSISPSPNQTVTPTPSTTVPSTKVPPNETPDEPKKMTDAAIAGIVVAVVVVVGVAIGVGIYVYKKKKSGN